MATRSTGCTCPGVIEEHFRITPDNPYDEGAYDPDEGWERRGELVTEVIAEIAGLETDAAEAIRDCLSEETRYDAHDGSYEDPFGSDTYYEEGRPDTHGFLESWESFRSQIKTRSRFFGRSAQQALEEIFGDLSSLRGWRGEPAIKELPTDEARFLYRARIAYSDSDLREILQNPVKRLGPPPWRLARAGRINAAGIAVFYGAAEVDTCIAEAREPVGSYVVLGRFEVIRPIRVLDLDVLARVFTDRSSFDPEFTTQSNRAAFLRHLVAEISRPIMPRDEEFEYLPTQAVSEYLASCIEPRLDGIIFHSAQTAREGRNVVLFHHAAGVESYALPLGTKVDVDMGWASEDDSDDNIVVWERVPPKPKKEKGSAKSAVSFDAILEGTSRDEAGVEWDEDLFYGKPTLKLDVEKIEVFRITAVSYKKTKRYVSRHRIPEDENRSF